MNKAELVDKISDITGFSKKNSYDVIEAFTSTVTNELAAGSVVNIVGFGRFEVVTRAPKIGRNPKTGQVVPIPASPKPKLHISKKLIDQINS